ncbi:MAG: single-stranded DNA-binding protein [Acidimicrobiales bacterium]|jgi:single-strand DNA-binding protein
MDNTVTVVGNLTRDPELRFTQSGQARAVLGIAVNRRWQNRQTNEWEEQVSFFNVVCWREMAENVAESLTRGTRVIVNGRLEQRSWDTQEGDKRSVVEIVADEIAPSLRWASAQVNRNERSDGGQGGGGGQSAPRQSGGGRPSGGPAKSQAGQPGQPGQAGQPGPDYGGGYEIPDEEPF